MNVSIVPNDILLRYLRLFPCSLHTADYCRLSLALSTTSFLLLSLRSPHCWPELIKRSIQERPPCVSECHCLIRILNHSVSRCPRASVDAAWGHLLGMHAYVLCATLDPWVFAAADWMQQSVFILSPVVARLLIRADLERDPCRAAEECQDWKQYHFIACMRLHIHAFKRKYEW